MRRNNHFPVFKEEGLMTKAELVVKIAEKAGMTKADAERCLNYFLDTVEETLVDEGKLTLTGFGTFQVDERKERVGRNPRTGEEIKIPACKVVKFRPGKLLKDAVK
ncbi:HU family DNA-binding protein [Maridesulfovibrio zosterae]|uniref:HU family DNA-binding protein n=1 Tax=Maridesulfovibrio zosterae TaxID=82171 RepID=UPI00247FB4F0|nr:HU family DNA-binding protein [Maridesulfovibrio zosterae]